MFKTFKARLYTIRKLVFRLLTMKLKDIFEIQKHFDRKKTPCDIIEILDENYYSKSKDKNINYSDMHITHYIRATQKTMELQKEKIEQLKKQLKEIRNFINKL